MSKIITEVQKHEIEELANNGHAEALIAYGADLYRQGIYKGAIIGIAGLTIGYAIYKIEKVIRTKTKTLRNRA